MRISTNSPAPSAQSFIAQRPLGRCCTVKSAGWVKIGEPLVPIWRIGLRAVHHRGCVALARLPAQPTDTSALPLQHSPERAELPTPAHLTRKKTSACAIGAASSSSQTAFALHRARPTRGRWKCRKHCLCDDLRIRRRWVTLADTREGLTRTPHGVPLPGSVTPSRAPTRRTQGDERHCLATTNAADISQTQARIAAHLPTRESVPQSEARKACSKVRSNRELRLPTSAEMAWTDPFVQQELP